MARLMQHEVFIPTHPVEFRGRCRDQLHTARCPRYQAVGRHISRVKDHRKLFLHADTYRFLQMRISILQIECIFISHRIVSLRIDQIIMRQFNDVPFEACRIRTVIEKLCLHT